MRVHAFVFVALVIAAAPARAQRVRPVVDVDGGYLLGVVVDGAWRDGEHGAAQVRGGERYRVFAGGRLLGAATGARPVSFEEPCPETFGVKLTPEREDAEVAVVGTWNVRPRPVTRGDATLPAYREVIRQLLVRHRMPVVVRITGVTRVDLDGDGTEEAIVSATRSSSETTRVAAGDYSILLVRKLVRGVPQTIILEEEYHARASQEEILNTYRLGGVYDLDGDGVYEILARGRYYEGAWSTVYRLRGTRPVKLASAGCGA
ncbi:MAG TPA: hypothetical protein VF541_09825 [Longimicrobium sp.]